VVLITAREDALATEQQLRARGIRPYLDAVYVANNNKAAALRQVKSATLVVGDTEHDIELATEFGYPCFAVTTGIRSREFLAEAHPTYLADSLSDLLAVL
jgi:phosphoglycolate phosphatase-like HAD superfamily hydrolase